MQTISRSTFTTVTTEGAILPADLLQRIVEGRDLDGLKPTDYHLAPNERLNEAINRSWNRLLGVWESFDERQQKLPEHDRGTTLTREGWLLILLEELGFGRPTFVRSLSVDGGDDGSDGDGEAARYPISHRWQHVPLHLITFRQSLDRVDEDRGERYRRSPHSLLQEFLNRSEQHLWGVVSNGLRLRLLRDNVSFTRAAYLEFDLEAMMDGEIYADFTLLWLAAHQSRFEGEPQSCWLEQWSQAAAEQGTRALDSLRDGVQNAISELGRGFLAHRKNGDLRAKLQKGDGLGQGLDKQAYYRQLLRLVYRLIFLFVAEERNLLLVADADAATRERYYDYYSVTHLRALAERRRSGPHPDLYRGLRLVMELLREGYEPLGLPGLGSFLFSGRSTPDLDKAEIANEALLKAIRALTFTIQDGVRRPVDYKNLGAEELGSVYESLLELHPELNVGAATFNLRTAAGSERKTTGSYYTPTSLISSLLDTALEPVVEDRLRGKKGEEAEEALLDIKVVDPAAGSGHFLIAAANRLARHLARIRTGDGEPSPEANRLALRDVVRHCIYGVDVNEMAVELCKVGLWLETLDPGKPLSFLDANIQCGNSLMGATPELLEEGIPDDAFKPITGDDKAYCREFKATNREQHKGKGSLFKGQTMQPWHRLGNLADAMQSLDEAGDGTVADVRAQEKQYEALVRSQDYQFGKLWADAWCAAFVWPKKPEGQGGHPYPITEEEFRRIEYSPHAVPGWMKEEIQALAEEYQFFHWYLAFPQVFKLNADDADETQMDADKPKEIRENPRHPRYQRSNSGFDVVLGNPPWERVKLQEKEWFATRSPEIANARNKAARTKLIKKLKKEDPMLYAAFQADKRRAEGESHFARNSESYPLTGRGDINTYQLFAGLVRRLLHPAGRAGIILPSGIATDYTTRYYFQDITESSALVSLYDFENREKLFPAVDSRMKFCLLTLTGPARPVREAEFLFFAYKIHDISDIEKTYSLSSEDIRNINPNTLTCPTFRSRSDARITLSIQRKVPVFDLGGEKRECPWACEIERGFRQGEDAEVLARLGFDGEQLLFTSEELESNEGFLPVYEGKSFDAYDHRHSSIVYNEDAVYRPRQALATTTEQRQDPYFVAEPHFWVREEVAQAEFPWEWFVVFKKITSSTNERTMVATILARCAVNDTTQLFAADESTPMDLLPLLCCNLNSFVLDYTGRQKLGGNSYSMFVVRQLPILPPCAYRNTQVSFFTKRLLELLFTSWDMRPFAQDVGYHGPPLRWDEERRFLLRCELDAAYFHLYGIERDDVDYIMDTFPIVRRKDEEAYGEYRTKRVILEIYDEMARAMETGEPYQTRLDPPPTHPDAAHPWDEEYLGPELPVEEWWEDGAQEVTRKDVMHKSVVRDPEAIYQVGDGEQPPALGLRVPRDADFAPPEGPRSKRLRYVMELGKKHREENVRRLVGALGDEDESIRWLAGSTLVKFGGEDVVRYLAAFLAQEPDDRARAEAERVLRLIADTVEDEGVREMAKEIIG